MLQVPVLEHTSEASVKTAYLDNRDAQADGIPIPRLMPGRRTEADRPNGEIATIAPGGRSASKGARSSSTLEYCAKAIGRGSGTLDWI